jgi:hypothetical protein
MFDLFACVSRHRQTRFHPFIYLHAFPAITGRGYIRYLIAKVLAPTVHFRDQTSDLLDTSFSSQLKVLFFPAALTC